MRGEAFSRLRTVPIALVNHKLSKLPATSHPQFLKSSSDSAFLDRLLAEAEATFLASRAGSTLRAYQHDWLMFRTWCLENALMPLPASSKTGVPYATDLTKNQGKSLGTLLRRLAAVSQLHQQSAILPTATWEMKKFMAGLRRQLGVAPRRKKAVLVTDLKKMLSKIPDTLLGKQDRVVLLLGFVGAFRRSEPDLTYGK
jgi:hypothetical protein